MEALNNDGKERRHIEWNEMEMEWNGMEWNGMEWSRVENENLAQRYPTAARTFLFRALVARRR